MSLATRIIFTVVAIATFTATVIGLLTYINLKNVVIPHELSRLQYHARDLITPLDNTVRNAREDVLALAKIPAVAEIVDARRRRSGPSIKVAGNDELVWRERLAKALVAQLEVKKDYVQCRLIGTEDNGKEIVRVDRSRIDGSVVITPDTGLQSKLDRRYFREAVRAPANTVYVSPIELNQENGAIEIPHLPVIRVATPVSDQDGNTFGIFIINIDLRPTFESLRKPLNKGGDIYLVNGNGDYLVHPDPNREFGFDLGNTANLRDEFPGMPDVLSSETPVSIEASTPQGRQLGEAMIPVRIADAIKVGLIETVPHEELYAASDIVQNSVLIAGFTALIGSGLLSFVLARSLTKPLVEITKAVEGFSGSENINISKSSGGEIATLARTFEKMGSEIRQKTESLNAEIEERCRIEADNARYIEKARLYRALIESSGDAIISKTLDGTILSWNHAAEEMYGFATDEAIGQNINLIVPYDKTGELDEILEAIRNGEKIEHLKTIRKSKTGKLIDVALTISPVLSDSGEIIGASTIARDITEQQRAEEKFRESEERFSKAFKSSPDAVVISLLEDGTILDVNDKWSELYGYSRDEALGKKSTELNVLFHPDERRRLVEILQNEGSISDLELDIVRKNGEVRNALLSMEKINLSGQTCMLTTARDITQRKRAEQELIASREQLRKLSARINEAVEEESKRIAADVHDLIGGDLVGLRHDLTVTRQLLSDQAGKPAAPDLLERFDNMDRLITNTLSTAKRISSELHPAELDFLGLIPALISEGERFSERTEIKFTIDTVIEDVSIDKDSTVAAFRIFQEALRNVFLHANASRIGVQVREDAYNFAMRISDNGRGITKTEHDAANSLGLLGMRERASRVNGEVTICGSPGKGTTVTIIIPLKTTSAAVA